MTSIGISHRPTGQAAQVTPRTAPVQTALLASGFLSALLYIGTDLVAASRYPGYRLVDQAVSELSAIGAPTRGLWAAMTPFFGVLFLAFAIGVIRASGRNRALRITGILLLTLAASGVLWSFFPMHQRGAEMTWTDVGHIVLSVWSSVIILLFVGFGAVSLGRRFRAYSLATMIAIFVATVVTFSWAPRIAAGTPSPWLGAVERIIIYGYLIWVAALSVSLLRSSRRAATPAVTV